MLEKHTTIWGYYTKIMENIQRRCPSYEKVYPIRLLSLGEDHSSTKEIVEWIAEVEKVITLILKMKNNARVLH